MQDAGITGIIDKGCQFEGSLSFTGTVRIAGEFKGDIFSNDTLIIADGAVVDADINANIIIISGTVRGEIRASSRVEMRKPAHFEGVVIAPSLIVEEGVVFHGETKVKQG